MRTQAQARVEVLSRICDALLITLAVLAIPTLGASLARIETVGPQPVMIFHILIVLAILIVTLLRRHVSYRVRSWFVILVISATALAGLATFGLVAAAGAWIPFAGVMGAILLGQRTGGLILLTTILAACAIGTTSILSNELPAFNFVAYTTSVSGWATQAFSWLMLGGTCVAAIGVLNRYFEAAVSTTQRQAESLAESERAYRDIFENMVDTVYRANLNGTILTISPSIVNMLGFEPEEVIGKELADYYVDPGERNKLVTALRASEGEVRNFEAQLYHRDGKPQWISTNVRYWKDLDGSVLGIEGVARNITSHRAAEEALRRSQKMDALGHLTGGIAHDFNNLLGVIIGNADVLEAEAPASSAAQQNAVEIIKAAEQGTALTRRLVSFSRPQVLAAEPTSIDAVIRNLEGMLRRTLGAMITLRLDLTTENASTLIDPHQLEASILNLAINARDAMPNGGELTLATARTTLDSVETSSLKDLEPGDYLRIIVRDTGTGMTDETAQNAFEPFFTTKPLGTGNGLGLSMVDGFATQSRGRVSIASKWGNGTSVTLLLPRSDAAPRTLDTTTPAPRPTREAARILAVEDAPALRSLVVSMLQSQGYKVIAAENGHEALDLLRHDTEIDLLFTDIVLPGGIDGYEIGRQASRIKSDIKILFTSGYASETPAEDDPLAKAPMVYKPYHRTQLLTKIEEVLAAS